MKLKELVKSMLDNNLLPPSIVETYTLDHHFLKLIKERLLECEEFQDISELTILEQPFAVNTEGKPFSVNTMNLGDDIKFKNHVYLYQISLTSEMFNPNNVHDIIKDNACITPIIYNTRDFTPERKIIMKFSHAEFESEPENVIDGLHVLLNKVLNNPKEYQTRGERQVMIRGLYETIEHNGEVINSDFGVLKTDGNEPEFYMAFYLDMVMSDGNVQDLELKSKLIPSRLKDKFIVLFNQKGTIPTGDDINNFLKENGYIEK